MNLTTIEVLGKAAELGLKLGFEPPDTLTVQPVNRCPHDFMETLRSYKPRLLTLLSLPFVVVRSKALDGEVLFFCENEDAKDALLTAGASEWATYTRDELRILVEQNRIAPLTNQELQKLHQIKRAFSATIAPGEKQPSNGNAE
jgi:hypothetical protein